MLNFSYSKTNIIVTVVGVFAGVLIWIYLKVNPINEDAYNMHVYYLNKEGKVEQTFMSKNKRDVNIIAEYYAEREVKPGRDVSIKRDHGSLFIIPRDCKVRVIDTVAQNVVKIQVLYTTRYGEKERTKGYVPIILLHKELPSNSTD